jgi:hypothetical protein
MPDGIVEEFRRRPSGGDGRRSLGSVDANDSVEMDEAAPLVLGDLRE